MEMLPEPKHTGALYKVYVNDVERISLREKELAESVFDTLTKSNPESKIEIWKESWVLIKQVIG